jgi:hypothetical protein
VTISSHLTAKDITRESVAETADGLQPCPVFRMLLSDSQSQGGEVGVKLATCVDGMGRY